MSSIRISSMIDVKQQTTLSCNLSPVRHCFTANLNLRGLFLSTVVFVVVFFLFLPHIEGWLFSPRALSFISQPSYSAEDAGSTGLGSYCSKGKPLLSVELLPVIQICSGSASVFSGGSCLLSSI